MDGKADSESGYVDYKGVAYITGGTIEAKGVGDIKAQILNK